MCYHALVPHEVMMGYVEAISDDSILLSTFVLLLATMAGWLAIGHWQRWVVGKTKNLESQAMGSQSSQVAPEEPPSSSTAQASPQNIPCGCGPGCTPCVTAAQELQDLVMSVWAGNGMSFPLDSVVWQVLWENLEELVEQGHLPCCSSSSSSKSPPSFMRRLSVRSFNSPRAFIRQQASVFSVSSFLPRTRFRRRYSILTSRPYCRTAFIPPKDSIPSSSLHCSESLPSSQSLPSSKNLSETCQAPNGRTSMDRSPSSQKDVGLGRTRSSLDMRMAKKSLEVKRGAKPIAVERSQEQGAQKEESCSHQGPPLDSWGAAAVPAGGNTPCVGEAQRSTLGAEEDPPAAKEVRDPSSPRRTSRGYQRLRTRLSFLYSVWTLLQNIGIK